MRMGRSASWCSILGILLALLALLAPGCNRDRNGASDDDSAGGEESEAPLPSGWPQVLVVGPGTGPALYVSSAPDAAAYGYVNPGVRVRLESAPQNGRVKALLAGPLPTRGWIPADRIAAYVQQRGRVEGTPFYVGPNDFVNVLGPAEAEGQMRIAVRPWLGGATFLDAQVGTFPTAQLAGRQVDAANAEQPTEGQCYRLPPGQTVPVYERPGAEPVAQLPAQDPPLTVVVLRDRSPWYGIRAGYGPYVVGYVQAQLTPCEGARPAPAPLIPTSGGEVPYWITQEPGNLYRVAANTSVTFNDRTIARLRQDGWARELDRRAGERVDVFVAVNDDVALRGLVPASALTLVESGERPSGTPAAPAQPAAPPPPDEDVPDELAE